MPKRFACAGIQCEKIPLSISSEDKPRIRGQHPGTRTARAKFMRPPDFARLIIDRFQHTLAPQPIVRTRPTVGTIRRLIEVEAIGRVGTDNKQASLRIEAGRAIVSEATLIRCNQAAVRRRILGWVWKRPP